uniref:pilus assembly protein TadG-related protein n=1 Tax=uncultured Psychrobacter sp. TaxID=259303 RepID=UPI002622F021|nr:pilus assembly protein TadG-related protein [uncultured Psychrobacter sp.]
MSIDIQNNQKGQALIFMLGFTLVLSISMIYLFNTSQLLAERTQAKVLADHAAYNTATKQAQLLNANAYMNKAKIANQLATAQAVSVASWAKHFEPMPQHTKAVNLIPVVGSEVHQAITLASNAVQPLADLTSPTILINNQATEAISFQQNLLNNSSFIPIQQVHKDTIEKSSIGAGFDSRPLITASEYAVNPLGGSFIKHYSGNSSDPTVGRARLKDVILASRDDFTRERRAKSIDNLHIPIFKNRLEARGGTELSNDMNQWKGVDTFSHHYKRWKRSGWRWRLKWREDQMGYGSAVVRNTGRGDNDRRNNAGYNNANRNRDASRRSNRYTPRWDSRRNRSMNIGESGVPQFWDLETQVLAQDEPTLPTSIRVSKRSNGLDTTSGTSNLEVGDQLNIISKDDVTAVSTAEVYFERPYTDSIGRPTYFNKNKLENASLFNPYWQVRLVNNSARGLVESNAL